MLGAGEKPANSKWVKIEFLAGLDHIGLREFCGCNPPSAVKLGKLAANGVEKSGPVCDAMVFDNTHMAGGP